jgi:branched-chain amino acid transport system substrate-binding protein
VALALVAAACSQRDDDDDEAAPAAGDEEQEADTGDAEEEPSIPTEDCVADPTEPVEGDTIRVVSSFPQSGPAASLTQLAQGWEAYFEMVNQDEGGVEIGGESFQIEFESRDDGFEAARTSANIRELVGEDGEGAFAVFSVLGTPNVAAIRPFLDELCVPNVFAGTGSPAWGNPEFPWTIGSTLGPYPLEARAFVDILLEQKPDATVAMLVQDDDFGRAYEEGFRLAIEGTDIEIVEVQTYAANQTDVAAQVTSLAATNADAFFNGAFGLASPSALATMQEANWDPITWISTTAISTAIMGISAESANGAYTFTNLKDPRDPRYDDDPAMQLMREKVEQFRPEGFQPNSTFTAFGWTQAAVFVEALKQAEEPTRLAVMESLRHLDNLSDVGLLLDGISISTGPDDAFMGESAQLIQYEFDPELGPDSFFVEVGEPLDFEGQGANPDITPPDLITDEG